MGDLLIRRIPDETLRQAKALAAKHNRSLQEEVSGLLIQAIRFSAGSWSREADVIRKRLSGRQHSDSVKLLREDRDR